MKPMWNRIVGSTMKLSEALQWIVFLTVIATVIILVTCTGCQETTYRHREWKNGKLVSDIQVKNSKAMAGTETKELSVVLTDGTWIGVDSWILTTDPCSIESIGKAIGAGARTFITP